MYNKKTLSVLVTAGGTREDIDAARCVANNSTGRLGSIIADVFTENGAFVTYLCGEGAVRPALNVYETVKIRSVSDLIKAFEKLLLENRYDCVIHSMAVSDYTPCAVTDTDKVFNRLKNSAISKEGLEEALLHSFDNEGKKISSDNKNLIVVLKQTPKVIDMIKKLQPSTLLVGFKLLSGVTENELINAGQRLKERCGCDYVLANDFENIKDDVHKAIFIGKTGIITRADTKNEIARTIYNAVYDNYKKKTRKDA